jgi:aromatic-L-amino-acid/L-tryptophan decarboxylase
VSEPDGPLRLDAPREEVLEHAAKLVAEAWQSFDRFRPEEPPLDERVRQLLRTELPEGPTAAHEALDDAARILDESIAQPRPRYFVGVGSSGLEIGTIADLLAHTYDVNLAVDARAATQIEKQAIRWAAELIGYAPEAAGAFTSGGTVSNATALAAAREHALPGSRHDGIGGRRVAVYCSQEVHYSITRAVETLGVGSRNLRAIPLGPERGLIPEALAETIDRDLADGVTPIAVVATAGTTLTGAIDPLEEIADICEERGIWFHVDGAYGLPAVLARAEAFRGFERAASVAVDAHKWLYLPKACGILLVRRQEDLVRSFAHEQGYLPHQQHDLHAMETTFEYSRPFRALKFWLAMRVHGADAFREAIERNLGEARLLYDTVSVREDFDVLGPPKLSIVAFRHHPADVTDLDDHNRRLADAIQADGRVWMSSALIDEQVWLRPCFVNFRTTEEDILDVVDIAVEIGERLAHGR